MSILSDLSSLSRSGHGKETLDPIWETGKNHSLWERKIEGNEWTLSLSRINGQERKLQLMAKKYVFSIQFLRRDKLGGRKAKNWVR